MASETYERVYRVVRRIPRGRVATYGQVARLAGLGGHARVVGYALSACEEELPWHRVINARGEISSRSDPFYERRQRDLLAREGVTFDARGRTSLARYRWVPGAGTPRAEGAEGPGTEGVEVPCAGARVRVPAIQPASTG